MGFKLDGILLPPDLNATTSLKAPVPNVAENSTTPKALAYLRSSELRGEDKDIQAVDELLTDGTQSRAILDLFRGANWDHRVSAAGRRALKEAPETDDNDRTLIVERAWILERILVHKDATKTIDLYWPRVVTGVLTLLDSTNMDVRVRGFSLVQLLANNFLSRLTSTGLVPLFWDAVLPSIGFLPPMADTKDVLKIHHPAVLAMISLSQDSTTKQHIVVLEGCIRALHHTKGNVELTIAFMDTLTEVCVQLQSIVIAHLSRLIPIIVSVLEDPFLDLSPSLLEATCRALAAVVRVSWPRISEYKYDISYGLIKGRAVSEFLKHFPTGYQLQELHEPHDVVSFFEQLK